MRIVELTKETKDNLLNDLLKRSPNNYGTYEATVAEIVNKVKTEGNKALFEYTSKFDHCEITKDTIRVTREEIDEAYAEDATSAAEACPVSAITVE